MVSSPAFSARACLGEGREGEVGAKQQFLHPTIPLHVKYLKTVCRKVLNELFVVGHSSCDADEAALSSFHCVLVRS